MDERRSADRPLRVCYLAETFYPVTGGGEMQGRLLVEALIARGAEVTVIAGRVPADAPPEETVFGARVLRVPPAADGPGMQRWPMMLTALRELARRRGDYDVIFVGNLRAMGVPAVVAARLFGKVCVLKPGNAGELSGAFFDNRLRKYGLDHRHWTVRPIVAARNVLLRGADYFCPNTTDTRDEFLGCRTNPERTVLVPNTYDSGRFFPAAPAEKAALRRNLGIEPERPVAVFTGRLVSWKGPQHAVSVWRNLVERGSGGLLILIGPDGNDMHDCGEEIRGFVERHALHDHIRMTGGIDNVEDYLRAADLFVFPSQGGETATTAVIEAQACGLPVVTTRVAGVTDLVTEDTAVVVDREDLAGLERAVEDLLHDPNRRARMGAAAAKRARETYAPAVIHAKLLSLFGGAPRGRRAA